MTTSDWISVVGLLFSAATLGVLLWTTFWRTPKPPLVFRIEPWGGPEHPNLFVAIIIPVEGHDGRMIGLRGHGVLLARMLTGGTNYDPHIIGPGPFARDLPTEWPLKFGQKEAVRIHFFASPYPLKFLSPSSWRLQKASSVCARISLTSPISVRIDKKISIKTT